MRKSMLVLAVACFAAAVACQALCREAFAEDDGGKEKILQYIKAIERRMQEAKESGDLEEYRKLREKLGALKAQLDGQGKTEGPETDAEVRQWKEKIEEYLKNSPPGERIERLKKLEGELRAKGENGKAEIVARYIKRIQGGEGSPMQAELMEMAKRIEALKAAREKAIEEFDMDKVDALSKEIEKLEDARRRIEKEIAARGTAERGKGPFAAETVDRLRKVIAKLEGMANEAEKAGDREKMQSVLRVLDGFRELCRRAESCGGPEEAEKLAATLREILEKGGADLKDAEAKGDMERAETIKWLLGDLKAAYGSLMERIKRPGPGGLDEEKARIQDLYRKADAIEAEGRHDEAVKIRLQAKAAEKALAERMGRGKDEGEAEGREGRMRKFQERMAELGRMIEEAEATGDEKRAAELREKSRIIKEEFAEGMKKRMTEKGPDRRMKFEERMKRLHEELARAEEDGDEERMDKVRDKIRKAREEMERADSPKDGGEADKPSKDAAELRKEIDRLRNELAELKALLKELLREREKD